MPLNSIEEIRQNLYQRQTGGQDPANIGVQFHQQRDMRNVATKKLAAGIRNLTADAISLEKFAREACTECGEAA